MEKKKLGRSKIFESPEELQKVIDKYYQERDSKRLPYTVESLSVALEIDRKTLLNYEKQEGYEEFFPTVKKAKDKIQSSFVDFALNPENKVAAALPIFLMKNNFGYEDKQEVRIAKFEIEF